MTEKRFTLENGNLSNVRCNILDYGYGYTNKGLCDLLNELHEEKEQLQHDATILIQSNQDYRKENEQLKQEIIQLRHWNKCLAEKRHQEISYRPYTASKSEKEELEEFLEQKVFNCSDR